MNKKLLSLLMAGALSLSVLPFSGFAAETQKASSVSLQVSDKTNWWGKDISADDFVVGGTSGLTFNVGEADAQGNATIKVTGTLKYVEGFIEFGGEELQNGYYLPIKATINDLTEGKTGMIGSTGRGGEKLNYGKTYRQFLFYVPESEDESQKLSIIVDADQTAEATVGEEFARTTYDLDLTGLKLGETELIPTEGNADLSVDTTNKTIKTISGKAIGDGIAAPSTAQAIKALFQNTGTKLEVRKPDNTVLNDTDKVYSGCTIVLKDASGKDADTVTLIIKGAFTSSGQCELSDLIKVAGAFKNTLTLSELEAIIGDANNSGGIDLADLVNIATSYKA